jgi:hypothetical protein
MRKDFYNIYNVRMTVLVILLAIFTLSAAAKDSVVERGMDKKEVKAILGKPKATSFDQYGETWTYYKESILDCKQVDNSPLRPKWQGSDLPRATVRCYTQQHVARRHDAADCRSGLFLTTSPFLQPERASFLLPLRQGAVGKLRR